MSRDSGSVGVETIKRRLKRKNAWHHNYLDEIVDSTLRSIGNKLSNDGPRAQVTFLLKNGWEIKEIVAAGYKVQKLIVTHVKGVHESKHRRRRNVSKHRKLSHR